MSPPPPGQVACEVLDASVCNAYQCGVQAGAGELLPREGVRVSLTVRRVLKVMKNLSVARLFASK